MHLYIHIPFCKQACHYCDFHFSTNLKSKSDLVAAICHEIALQKDYLPHNTLQTIYFGGGTPSLLTVEELEKIFDTIHLYFQIETDAEITLEANPDDLSYEKLISLKPFVNRLSIGLQSFHEPYLRFMNRAHDASQSYSSVKLAQDCGFDNLTIDLIYGMSQKQLGLSSSTDSDDIRLWEKDLEMAVGLGTPHISAYNLTIEPQTALGNWLRKGKIQGVDEELSARHFELMVAYLENHHFEQYEISNFARNHQYAIHNSSYWKRRPYLGIGPSAHSFNGSTRQYNIANNIQYLKSLQTGTLNVEIETLTPFDQVNDYILTSLRTIWGCDLWIIQEISGINLLEVQKHYLKSFVEKAWLYVENNKLFLTRTGRLFADRIAADLFLV